MRGFSKIMKGLRSATLVALVALTVCLGSGTPAWAVSKNTADVTVTGDKQWVDTGIDVNAGDKLHITAKGTVDFVDNKGITPEGAPRGWKDVLRALTVSSAGRGALVGQIGDDRAATPFYIGTDGTVLAPTTGRLFLGVNQDSEGGATGGKFQVHVDRIAATIAAASGANASAGKYDFQPLFATLDKDLPYRVTDRAALGGNEGDLVNFVLVGSQEQVTSAFKAAGWVQPDKTNDQAVVSAIMATLQKQAYVTMPISTLYLFGRGQDFGYARAQAIDVIAQRDHFRIWKAPFAGPKNEILWAGAGTHDIGIERDQRTENGITHKIDSDIDKERDFIAATLQQVGWVEAMAYMDRPKQIKETKTATGGGITTDGRTLVIVLKSMEAPKPPPTPATKTSAKAK
jgi:hypothetical protein